MHGCSNGGCGAQAGDPDGEGGLVVPSSWEKEGITGSLLPKETTWRRSDKALGEGWIFRGLVEAEGSAAGFSFFFKNSSLRLAFLLLVDGLGIFFWVALLLVSKAGTFSLVSREKEKVEPMEMEKLNALPWLTSVWQSSKHLVAKEESLSSTAVILLCTSELVIFKEDQKITHASSEAPLLDVDIDDYR